MPFGVSNSFKRGIVKTYSRQRARIEISYDTDQPRKRICMDSTGVVVEKDMNHSNVRLDEPTEAKRPLDGQAPELTEEHTPSSVTAPSSPAQEDRNLLSSDFLRDEDSELSSPPSSPPSRLPSPVTKVHRPAFSFLKRKRSTLDDGSPGTFPLSDITPNALRGPPSRPAKKAMTQMQLDLGGENRKTCRTCGMEYIPSIKEDAKLHKEVCGINVGGIEMGKGFSRDETLRRITSERASGREKEEVLMIDRKCSQAVRVKVKKVLEVVNAELSAVEIDDKTLWEPLKAETTEEQLARKQKGVWNKLGKINDRFKAFLYMVGDRCVGFCLAEKINNAHAVIDPEVKAIDDDGLVMTSRSSSISVSAMPDVALIGIARIWTSRSFRCKGLALNLLECARRNFFYGLEVPRNLVAFSQPTESGGQLAERWFEATAGWHVYRGDG